MSQTFTQIYVQIVFSVKGREMLLLKPWRTEVFQYITGIIKGKNQKPIIVNGVSNHVHILVGLKSDVRISDLVRDIKNNSSSFIKDKKFIKGKFAWQEGYGAFSYAKSEINIIYDYIKNQEQHHKKRTYEEEFMDYLKEFEINFNENYVFD